MLPGRQQPFMHSILQDVALLNEGHAHACACVQVGSCKGRVAMQHIEDAQVHKRITFKGHWI